ncbi:MAG: prepilin peptidase [Acidobacteriota bacterium]|nr:prepilin peptidase [Acidobacteriota bacterium]
MEAMILFGLLSLCWGSFLNVVIYRLPRGLNLSHPPSTCPACRARIRPLDNIPILSYLVLQGRCRSCGARVSPRYIFVEALTPVCLAILFFRFGLGWSFAAFAVFTTALICLAFIDLDLKLLPDKIVFPTAAVGLLYAFFRPDMNVGQALLGAAVGGGFLLLVFGLYYLIRKKEGLGMGDVTMMVMIGVYLGWPKTVLTLILASFAGALVGGLIMAVRKKDLQFALPFGTFLAPAAYVALIWGDGIIGAYLSLFPNP